MKGHARARAVTLMVAAMAAAAALTSCARTASYLVLLEPPLWAALDGGSLVDRLAPVARQVGRRFEVRRALAAETPLRELEEILNERSYRGVVVGPLLALEVDQIAPAFAEVMFVALRIGPDAGTSGSAMASPAPSANVSRVSFARADGHRRAGRLLAVLEPAGTIGIISVRGRDERAITAFRDGYVDAGGRAAIVHRRLASTRDPGEIRRLVEELGSNGVATTLLRAGPLTPEGLEVMRGEGMRAIVMNWALARSGEAWPLADTVLCSIDDDVAGALAAFFHALDEGTTSAGIVGSTLVRCGTTRLPDDAAVYVDRTGAP